MTTPVVTVTPGQRKANTPQRLPVQAPHGSHMSQIELRIADVQAKCRIDLLVFEPTRFHEQKWLGTIDAIYADQS